MRVLPLARPFVSLLAIAMVAPPAMADEEAKDRAVLKLEKLLQANKTKEAEALAKQVYGEDGCETSEIEGVKPGNRRYATLGVLARRTGQHELAARCDVAAVLTTDSATLAAAALYELSRVAAKLTDAEFAALGLVGSPCPHLFEVEFPNDLQNAVGMEFARLRAKATEDLLHQSLRIYPNRAVVAALVEAGKLGSTEVRDAMAAYAPAVLVARGPFADRSSARKAMRREAETPSKDRRPVQPDLPAAASSAGGWKLKSEAVQFGCDESWFVTFERGGTVHFVPVLYNLYQGEDCGGYGEVSSGGTPKWLVPQHIARVQATHNAYTNTSCGPAGDDEEPDIFCELSGPAPQCLDLGGVRRWVSCGDDTASIFRGVEVRYSPRKGVKLRRTTGPRELTKALQALDGATLPQLLQGLGPALDAASAALSQ